MVAHPRVPGRWRARIAGALAACIVSPLLLGACGGGVSIGLGVDSGFDIFVPPAVSLAVAASTVRPGESLRLVAAAADESGIESVAFYRLDNGIAVLLGSVGSEPYEWLTVVPADGRTTLRLFARATDNTGQRADSSIVAIAVLP